MNDIAGPAKRHKTVQVNVGGVRVGGGAPVVVQSMTIPIPPTWRRPPPR